MRIGWSGKSLENAAPEANTTDADERDAIKRRGKSAAKVQKHVMATTYG
jgi:hypothetical protein